MYHIGGGCKKIILNFFSVISIELLIVEMGVTCMQMKASQFTVLNKISLCGVKLLVIIIEDIALH